MIASQLGKQGSVVNSGRASNPTLATGMGAALVSEVLVCTAFFGAALGAVVAYRLHELTAPSCNVIRLPLHVWLGPPLRPDLGIFRAKCHRMVRRELCEIGLLQAVLG